MKKFNGLLKSEIKKAQALANKINGATDCKVTGYSLHADKWSDGTETEGIFYTAVCEICHNYETRAEKDVVLHIFMEDRRRTFASEY